MTRTHEEAERWLEDHRDYPINPAITVGQFVDVLTAHLCGGAIRAESAPYAETITIGATGSPTSEAGKVEEAIDTLVQAWKHGGATPGHPWITATEARLALLSAIEADKAAAWTQLNEAWCAQMEVQAECDDRAKAALIAERDEARAKLAATSVAVVDYEAGQDEMSRGVYSAPGEGTRDTYNRKAREVISAAIAGAVSVNDVRLVAQELDASWLPESAHAAKRILAALAKGEAK